MKRDDEVVRFVSEPPGSRSTVSFYLADVVVEKARRLAKARGVSVSEAVERLLQLGIGRYEAAAGPIPEKPSGTTARVRPPQRRKRPRIPR